MIHTLPTLRESVAQEKLPAMALPLPNFTQAGVHFHQAYDEFQLQLQRMDNEPVVQNQQVMNQLTQITQQLAQLTTGVDVGFNEIQYHFQSRLGPLCGYLEYAMLKFPEITMSWRAFRTVMPKLAMTLSHHLYILSLVQQFQTCQLL